MAIDRASHAVYRSFALLGLLLLAATGGVALTGTSLFRHLNPLAGWVMVLLPSSPWLLFWAATAAAGFSRWGPMRFILAASSPLLIWQGLKGLGCGSDQWVPMGGVLFWTRVQGGLELALALASMASIVIWRLESCRSTKKNSQAETTVSAAPR